eukprot:TRINITY_DN10219_c0_g1_i1.p1 TRINITY_DN10219_c0_g1~~TRINITY_DN10219_c0_g1_i1.p1  ORF type:complete len:489 (+),score=140.16 TRINITY_DN10219_c0_g1_i1:84-1550(+)
MPRLKKRNSSTSLHDHLQRKANVLERKIHSEMFKLQEISKKINEIQKGIKEQNQIRKDIGGVDAAKYILNKSGKETRILENRLNKMRERDNSVGAKIERTKEKINSYRLNRLQLEEVFSKLRSLLDGKKRELEGIMQNANFIFAEREQILSEVEELKRQRAIEASTDEKKLIELNTIVERERATQRLNLVKKRKKFDPQAIVDQQNKEQEIKLRQKMAALSQEISREQDTVKYMEEKLESHEEAFALLRKHTGEEDLNELVEQFIDRENAIFGLFNHVQGVNSEIERTDSRIQAIKDEMKRYEFEQTQFQGDRKRKLEMLNSELERLKGNMAASTKRGDDCRGQLLQLASTVQRMVTRLGCETGSDSEQGGGLAGPVSENNIMEYMGLVEQRTNEIMRQYMRFLTTSKFASDLSKLTDLQQHPLLPRRAVATTVDLSLSDKLMTTEEGDEEKPLRIPELFQHTRKKFDKVKSTASINSGSPSKRGQKR